IPREVESHNPQTSTDCCFQTHLNNLRNCSIYNLASEGLKYNCHIGDCKLCKSKRRQDLPLGVVLYLHYCNYISISTSACTLYVNVKAVFQVFVHVGAEI